MEVRHNTALLEKALEEVVRRASIPSLEAEARARGAEADALATHSRSVAVRRLAAAGAIAIAAIGLAVAFKLYSETSPAPQRVQPRQESALSAAPAPIEPPTAARPPVQSTPAQPRPEPVQPQPARPPALSESSSARGPVVTDFTKFARREVALAGRDWLVMVGHQFKSESDPDWMHAWCYTTQEIDGVNLKLDQVARDSPKMPPEGLRSSEKAFREAGLTQVEGLALAAACAWSDRSFAVDEITLTGTQSNPFQVGASSLNMNGRTLQFTGPIGADFLANLKRHEFDTLSIESTGGQLDEAIRAGEWLRQQGKNVEVRRSCLSACVLVLAGGVSREAGSEDKVGVHRFSRAVESLNDGEVAQQKSAEIVAYLRRMGVEVELFQAMASVSSEEMRYLTRNDMIAWRLIKPPPLQLSAPTTLPGQTSRQLRSASENFISPSVGAEEQISPFRKRLLILSSLPTRTTQGETMLFSATSP